MSIRILVNGAQGKMGQEVCRAIKNAPGLLLVAETGKEDDLSKTIQTHQAQVVVDFTLPSTVYETLKIIDSGAHPVIGTSGLSLEQVQQLQQRCAEKKLGGLIAPNFAIGMALMNKYAQDCARYFPDVEIIECHHAAKVDAPSGTAVQTAQLISAARTNPPATNPHEHESLAGVRGGRYNGIPIHSVRVPGLLAQQIVLFGGQGQTLTLRHDALSRETYMPGVCLACHKVMELDHLVYGLEQIL